MAQSSSTQQPQLLPAWAREPIKPYQPLSIYDFPPDVAGLMGTVVHNVNEAVKNAWQLATKMRDDSNAHAAEKELSFHTWKWAWRTQYALKGVGAGVAEELEDTIKVSEHFLGQELSLTRS
jgi:hypothetical protein